MKLYRCECWNSSDGVRVSIHSYVVVRETKAGYWIDVSSVWSGCLNDPDSRWPDLKWVSASGKKRFAYPTQEEAVESFRARRSRYISILKERIERAYLALEVDPLDMQSYHHESSTYMFPERGTVDEFKDATFRLFAIHPLTF